MKFIYKQRTLPLLLLLLLPFLGMSQSGKKGTTVDKIAGIIGDKIILLSDIEFQYQQYKNQGLKKGYDISGSGSNMKCQLFSEMLKEKMMLIQAKADSITVTDKQVNNELERRIRYFVSQIGSRQKLEEYYGKSIVEIKDEFRSDIRDRLIAQQMRNQIIKDVKVTPTAVRNYFNNLPEDSLPYYNAQVEVAQIVRFPQTSELQDSLAREKTKELRQRIKGGEDFETMAIIYSEDKATAQQGGEMGFKKRSELPKSLQGPAFSLDQGEVSKVIASEQGYHLIKMLKRRGEKINLRHILIQPTITSSNLAQTEQFLDSLRTKIKNGSLKFSKAARRYSQDEETKQNGGMLMNRRRGSTYFNMEQLDPSLYFAIEKLEPGEISKPTLFRTQEGKKGYKIVKLISETEPHKASLEKDYNKIQEAAKKQRQQEVMQEWLKEKAKKNYVFIAPEFKKCPQLDMWLEHSNSFSSN